MKQGKIIFISGPSGVGKGTLISALKKLHPDWIFPPSCTTRSPRPGEIDGETYFFISKDDFQQKIEEGEFLEWANVHGENFYGTLKTPLLKGVEDGKIVVREFDVQGFLAARDRLPRETFISIFLKPAEDIDALVRRIRDRAPIADEEIERRIVSMKKELATADNYDFAVVSVEGEIEKMVQDAEEVIAANSKDYSKISA